jgi:hypothetical protein
MTDGRISVVSASKLGTGWLGLLAGAQVYRQGLTGESPAPRRRWSRERILSMREPMLRRTQACAQPPNVCRCAPRAGAAARRWARTGVAICTQGCLVGGRVISEDRT